MEVTLIFPSSIPSALEYYRLAKARGERLVAASSLPYDETSCHFETWFHLPFIHEPDFVDSFAKAIKRYEVRRVYCPNAAVHNHIRKIIREKGFSVQLVGDSPITFQMSSYRELLARADSADSFIRQVPGSRSTLSRYDIAAILREASNIYGESSDSKIVAMMAAFASAPLGDVVEIGALLGKSAFVLSYLAGHYHTGPVLIIDSWEANISLQCEASALVQGLSYDWDWELMFDAFRINMLPVAGKKVGYLRMTSSQAQKHYSRIGIVETPAFGKVEYAGRVAVIHIDGNHDYVCVNEDYCLWEPFVQPGGWIILDDYYWPHGDGPRRVGDAVLEKQRDQIDTAFVAGKALFIRLREQ